MYRFVLRSYSRWSSQPHVAAAVCRIQGWYRHWCRYLPSNAEDPITLEPPSRPIFYHVGVSGGSTKVTQFDARVLCEYFWKTGKFEHPYTRVPFHDAELLRLDRRTSFVYDILRNKARILKRVSAEREHESQVELLIGLVQTSFEEGLHLCLLERGLSYTQWCHHVEDPLGRLHYYLMNLTRVQPSEVSTCIDRCRRLYVQERLSAYNPTLIRLYVKDANMLFSSFSLVS